MLSKKFRVRELLDGQIMFSATMLMILFKLVFKYTIVKILDPLVARLEIVRF